MGFEKDDVMMTVKLRCLTCGSEGSIDMTKEIADSFAGFQCANCKSKQVLVSGVENITTLHQEGTLPGQETGTLKEEKQDG